MSKAEKAAIIAAFMKAADKLAMCELLKALRGSKWRFNLFELVQAGTCSLRSVKARLADANEGQDAGVNGLLDSADQNEFRPVPELVDLHASYALLLILTLLRPCCLRTQ